MISWLPIDMCALLWTKASKNISCCHTSAKLFPVDTLHPRLDLQCSQADADLYTTFVSLCQLYQPIICRHVHWSWLDIFLQYSGLKEQKKYWDKEDDEDKVEEWCCRTSNGPPPPRAPLREVSKRGMRKWAAMLLMGPVTVLLLSSCKVK